MPNLTLLAWTDDDLDEMAAPERLIQELESAKTRYRDAAPDEYDDLLDAREETDGAD